jgi:hypothetical protein
LHIVQKGGALQTFEFESSSNPDPNFRYHTQIGDDGRLGCDCMPWRAKKVGKARQCGHTKKLIIRLGLTIVERGDYQYVTSQAKGGAAAVHVEPPPVQAANDKDGYVAPMLAGQMPDGKTIDDFGDDHIARTEIRRRTQGAVQEGLHHQGLESTWPEEQRAVHLERARAYPQGSRRAP